MTIQMDLADMSGWKKDNDGCVFILIVCDVYSHMVFARSLKSKSGAEVSNSLLDIFKTHGLWPMTCFSDEGLEFWNKSMAQMLADHGIKQLKPNSPVIKCGQVEKMVQYVKRKIEKYMHANGTRRYIDVLQDICDSINNTVCRTIQMRPVDVTENIFRERPTRIRQPVFTVGTAVRISTERATFQKGYEKAYSDEEFVIYECVPGDPPIYRLMDAHGEPIEGIYYYEELVECKNPEQIFRIEKILDHRVRKGKREVLIKWLGYNDTFNSWELETNVALL